MSSSPSPERIDQLCKEIDTYVDLYSSAGTSNHRLAFWHDVGVTGLSALATTLLGVAEIADDTSISKLLRVFVLFVTGSVTVFAACGQFFKFKAKAQAYHSAAAQLLNLRRRLDRKSSGAALSTEQLERFFEDLDAIAVSVEPVWPNATVWRSPTLRTYGVLAVLALLLGLLAFAFRAIAILPAK